MLHWLLAVLPICAKLYLHLVHGMPHVCAPNAGCLQGIYMRGFQIDKFEAFLGIPYALPPIGELRFSSPKMYPKWQGNYNATAAKSDCIQKNYLLPRPVIYGEEDCLYLNVYRPIPKAKVPDKLPVLVYIHGGGFFSGSANPNMTGPEYFMDRQDVIMVTIAYRLGALGFLATDDHNMPGNFGLKDQNMALQWIQQNIVAFNGDARRVTIFGQSVGGVAVHLHLLSKQSQGLFHNIILISGNALSPFAINDAPLLQARKIAQLCNITHARNLSTAKLTRALRNVNVLTLLNAGDGLKYWHIDHLVNYRPVVERNWTDAFLIEHPQRLLATGNYKALPTLIGTVPQEGGVRVVALMENATLLQNFNQHFEHLMANILEYPMQFNAMQIKAKTRRVIDEYFKGQHVLNADTAQGFMDLISDRGFTYPTYNVLHYHAQHFDAHKQPIYMYRFNYSGSATYAHIYAGANLTRDYGVVHGDDLIYLLRAPLLFTDFQRNTMQAKLIQTFVNYLVHFAKFSNVPANAPALSACNAHSFNATANSICDYHEFINGKSNAFEIRSQNYFNMKRMQLWRELLHVNSYIK